MNEPLTTIEPPGVTPSLTDLRLKKGLSLEEVALRLRITTLQAAALEGLQFTQLPRPPYLQGFVRNYCRLLDTDPSPFIEMANASVNRSKPAVRDDPRELGRFDDTIGMTPLRTRRMWHGVVAIVGLTAVALLVIEHEAWLPGFNKAGQSPLHAANTVVGQMQPASLPPPTVSAIEPVAVLPEASVMATATPDVTAASLSTPGPQVLLSGKRMIRLVFRADSWAEVREANGRVLLSQLNKANSEQSFAATPPLKLTIGAAREVVLEVDGKPFDLGPYLKDDVARLSLP